MSGVSQRKFTSRHQHRALAPGLARRYDLPAPIYGWFTEGFDTADMQEARALLDEPGG
jgi:hypothetical protein